MISNNHLTGEISLLLYFNLSDNHLNGTIPQCLATSSLLVLDLANNHGNIPNTFVAECTLRMVDLSHNQFEGRLPRILSNCEMLESPGLSGNQIYDSFLFWLGSLPKFELLNLRSNRLFGTLEDPATVSQFPELHILDLSENELTGVIPSKFFQYFEFMKFDLDQMAYMNALIHINAIGFDNLEYQTTMRNKGRFLKYLKILNVLSVIDLSSNKFQGDIPEAINNSKMLNVLNFSNNHFSGSLLLDNTPSK